MLAFMEGSFTATEGVSPAARPWSQAGGGKRRGQAGKVLIYRIVPF
ncbi:hypothetical protein GCM10010217_45390 [Streptomyces tubercidicus]